MRTRCRAAVTTAIALAATLTGCALDRAVEPAPAARTSPAQEPFGAGGHNDEGQDIELPADVPTWSANARADALKTATAVMGLFARPQAPRNTWWSDLQPHLTSSASVAYEYVEPAEVPASSVTGPATLTNESSAFLAPVDVPTNVGTYTVLLARTSSDASWLVERITPPETTGP